MTLSRLRLCLRAVRVPRWTRVLAPDGRETEFALRGAGDDVGAIGGIGELRHRDTCGGRDRAVIGASWTGQTLPARRLTVVEVLGGSK